MSSKTPAQRPFPAERPGRRNPLICLHTAEVTGSIPVALTARKACCCMALCGWPRGSRDRHSSSNPTPAPHGTGIPVEQSFTDRRRPRSLRVGCAPSRNTREDWDEAKLALGLCRLVPSSSGSTGRHKDRASRSLVGSLCRIDVCVAHQKGRHLLRYVLGRTGPGLVIRSCRILMGTQRPTVWSSPII